MIAAFMVVVVVDSNKDGQQRVRDLVRSECRAVHPFAGGASVRGLLSEGTRLSPWRKSAIRREVTSSNGVNGYRETLHV